MRSVKPDRIVEADATTTSSATFFASKKPAPNESEPSGSPPYRVEFWYPTPTK